MSKVKKSKTIKIDVSESLLTKLTWAYPHGTNEQRVEFVIEEAIQDAESREGVTYPDDCLPGNTFRETRIKT